MSFHTLTLVRTLLLPALSSFSLAPQLPSRLPIQGGGTGPQSAHCSSMQSHQDPAMTACDAFRVALKPSGCDMMPCLASKAGLSPSLGPTRPENWGKLRQSLLLLRGSSLVGMPAELLALVTLGNSTLDRQAYQLVHVVFQLPGAPGWQAGAPACAAAGPCAAVARSAGGHAGGALGAGAEGALAALRGQPGPAHTPGSPQQSMPQRRWVDPLLHRLHMHTVGGIDAGADPDQPAAWQWQQRHPRVRDAV